MKAIKYTAAALLTLCLVSCSDFLNLKPRDVKVVSTIEDYRDIMASYMRVLKTPDIPLQEKVFGINIELVPFCFIAQNLGIYTGEANLNISSSAYFEKQSGKYTQKGKNMLTWLMTNSEAWSAYYAFLGPINLIISDIDKAEGDNETLRSYVKGEALVWRAYAFYKLLQYYAPYANAELGVPMYLTPELEIGTTMPERATQSQIFGQILSDLDEAEELYDLTGTQEWTFALRSDFIDAMRASIYMWKAMGAIAESGDWSKAAAYADRARKGRSLRNSPEDLKAMFDCSDEVYAQEYSSDEVFVRIMDGRWTYITDFRTAYVEGGASDGLVPTAYNELFTDDDIRPKAWFSDRYADKYHLRGSIYGGESNGCMIPFRLAEMYLIKAEAELRQGNAAEARTVMEEFVAARYTQPHEVPLEKEALLDLIITERQKEFFQENDIRWLDMKRLGVKVERFIAGDIVVLQPDDFRYNFPIPAREMKLNKNMVQNPGWESIILF